MSSATFSWPGGTLRPALFYGLALFSLTPLASPGLALGLGAALGLTLGNPFPAASARGAKLLLQACVVGLGFGMPLAAVLQAGASGIGYTVAGIAVALTLGLLLGRWLGVGREASLLITAGTSICGGSAIAAVGPAIGARAESMSISLATVFLLNAVALYLFPPIGHLLGLSQEQFALWAAIAIHDTSSVVGAASVYGAEALQWATVLKLARALWIVPLTLAAAWYVGGRQGADSTRQGTKRQDSTRLDSASRDSTGSVSMGQDSMGQDSMGQDSMGQDSMGQDSMGSLSTGTTTTSPGARVKLPWFIALFLLAAVARTLLPAGTAPLLDGVAQAARVGLVLALFLIGAGLTRTTLRAVGVRPLAQGIILWGAMAGITLLAVSWR